MPRRAPEEPITVCTQHAEMYKKINQIWTMLLVLLGLVAGWSGKEVAAIASGLQVVAPVIASEAAHTLQAEPGETP
jgi:hypothetical protein